MNVENIKELMNDKLITEVVDVNELAKKSNDYIRENYVTQVVDLPDFTNDDIEVPTEEPIETPTEEQADDEPVVDEGDDEINDPIDDENGDAPVVDEGAGDEMTEE